MSEAKVEPIVFLCCYCGIKIKKNFANLKRHEKIHTNHQKVKCAAKTCGKIVHKHHYWTHWKNQHKSIQMPDELNFVDIMGHQPKANRNKEHETNESELRMAPEKPNNFYVLNCLGLIHKVETKIEHVFPHCFTKDPSFGDLK